MKHLLIIIWISNDLIYKSNVILENSKNVALKIFNFYHNKQRNS